MADVHPYEFDVSDFRTPDKTKIRDSIVRMTDKRFALARHRLLTTKPWDFFMMVEMGTDRVHHAFWQYMDPETPPLRGRATRSKSVIADYYEHVDRKVGDLLDVLPGRRPAFVVVSDHGGSVHGWWDRPQRVARPTRLPRPPRSPKAALVRNNGAAHVIIGTDTLAADVKRLTSGAMVPVVYDSVGRETFKASLECLAPLGLMVTYGSSSGAVPAVEPALLSAKGSLFLTRPSLATYTAKRADLETMAADLFGVVASGAVKVGIHQSFPLQDAAAAHTALEARQTTGSTVLIP